MKKMYITLFLFVVTGSAQAGVTLEGDYQLAGPLTHQGETTSGNSHLYITLTKDAAKKLYDALEGKPIKDMCTGYNAKGQGNVGCYEVVPGNKYVCGFSINLAKNSVEAAEPMGSQNQWGQTRLKSLTINNRA